MGATKHILIGQLNSNLSNKIEKSSSQQLITNKGIVWTSEYQAIAVSQGVIPTTGFLNLIFQLGQERYSVFFDTARGVMQPFFLGQDETYNFYLNLRIDSDTKLSVRLRSVKGYTVPTQEERIWLRTYYVS